MAIKTPATPPPTHAAARLSAVLALAWTCACPGAAPEMPGATARSGGLEVSVLPDGAYAVKDAATGWELSGRLPAPARAIAVTAVAGTLGKGEEISFTWDEDGGPLEGSIALFGDRGLFHFQWSCPRGLKQAPAPFPDFSRLPSGLLPYSFQPREFAPPSFSLQPGAGPWMLFDARDRALVLSPSRNFLNAALSGDGGRRLAGGLNPGMDALPPGFRHGSVLALGPGINRTLGAWGRALRDLAGRADTPNDADPMLNTLGYWTDAGGTYWYHYDEALGYEGTLKGVAASFKARDIPLGYMQLDSWWYPKTLMGPSGVRGGPRNPALPQGDWNRYGGTLDYRAHPFVFPRGMREFSDAVGLPLANHNRWIDPSSPYHQRFRISGLAAVDRGFWDEIAGYLKDSGSFCYEQDWLNQIFLNSPELASRPGLGDEYLDNMAAAFAARGMSVQYCMPLPLHFLQASRYANVTTMRTCVDRFEPARYHDFLFTSRLASVVGSWPWCDVFMSGETGNLLLATLSAGPVGVGDPSGQEDRASLMRSARADGVILKPDAPIAPTDASYLDGARGDASRPLVACTYTDHGGLRTVYAVALRSASSPRSVAEQVPGQAGRMDAAGAAPGTAAGAAEPKSSEAGEGVQDGVSLDRGELGGADRVYAFDYFAGTGRVLGPGEAVKLRYNAEGMAFGILAPVVGGVALLGDADKFVGTAKKRLAALRSPAPDSGGSGGLEATLVLAQNEDSVRLRGWAQKPPRISVKEGGRVPAVDWDPESGAFTATVRVDPGRATDMGDNKPVRALDLSLTISPAQSHPSAKERP